MKRIKISIFGIMAIAIGIAASAFSTGKNLPIEKEQLSTHWYQFMGTDPTDATEVQDNENYSYVDGSQCGGDKEICAVNAQGDGTADAHPDEFSLALKAKLAAALADPNSKYPEISREQ